MTNQELIKKLKDFKNLETGGQPQASWVSSNKELLMSQVQPKNSFERVEQEKPTETAYYIEFINNILKQRVLRPAVATLMVISMMLTYTATVSVANASLPGDMLYPVKTATENVQLVLTFDEEKRVELQMDFVGRRVDELQQIVKKEESTKVKKEKVIQAVKQISKDIKEVQDSLDNIESDSKMVIAVAKDIDEKASQIKSDIESIHEDMPDDIKDDVEKDVLEAISDSQNTSDDALDVVLARYQDGDEDIKGEEVASRLGSRIKELEDYIMSASLIKAFASSTDEIIEEDESDIDVQSEPTATSSEKLVVVEEDVEEVVDQTEILAEIEILIETAKDLLDEGSYLEVMARIQDSKNLINIIRNERQTVVIVVEDTTATSSVEMLDLDSNTETSTVELLNLNNLEVSSSTEVTSESTDSLLKD